MNDNNKTNHLSSLGASLESNDTVFYNAITSILHHIGEDPTRDGLIDTPKRMLRGFAEMFSGYKQDPVAPLMQDFSHDHCAMNEPICVRYVSVRSFCEHHMLPIVGCAHIAYLPHKKIPGLSKVARTVDILSRRLQSQERLTQEIGEAFAEALTPQGIMVIVSATHHCMLMRGVKEQAAITDTVYCDGVFADDAILKHHVWQKLTSPPKC